MNFKLDANLKDDDVEDANEFTERFVKRSLLTTISSNCLRFTDCSRLQSWAWPMFTPHFLVNPEAKILVWSLQFDDFEGYDVEDPACFSCPYASVFTHSLDELEAACLEIPSLAHQLTV